MGVLLTIKNELQLKSIFHANRVIRLTSLAFDVMFRGSMQFAGYTQFLLVSCTHLICFYCRYGDSYGHGTCHKNPDIINDSK